MLWDNVAAVRAVNRLIHVNAPFGLVAKYAKKRGGVRVKSRVVRGSIPSPNSSLCSPACQEMLKFFKQMCFQIVTNKPFYLIARTNSKVHLSTSEAKENSEEATDS